MKIFLTGDNHIGLKYASHPQAALLAASRVQAFHGMVEAANREDCGLFVIAGDLFENTYGIAKKDIRSLLEILAQFRGTVAVLPGNHDYYDKDTVLWRYFADVMAEHDNIMLLNDYRPYEIAVNGEDVVLYPAHCTALHSAPGENNLGWLKNVDITPDDGAYHIGIAHGAVEGETIDKEGQYFLMRRDELEQIPLDVWLIGHTHVPFPRNLSDDFAECGDERIFNAGTHVQTDVACNTDGECFIIEITPQKTVRAKKFVSGNLRFYRKTLNVAAGSMAETIAEALRDIDDNSVVELILNGAVTGEEYEERAAVIDGLLARFVEGDYNDYALSRLISRELIEAEFAETSFSAGFLGALLDEPKEAQLAYEMLKSLKEGR